jgi:hypothetical protein
LTTREGEIIISSSATAFCNYEYEKKERKNFDKEMLKTNKVKEEEE